MWKQRALREGCVEVLAIRRWSAAGSHRRGVLRRTGRRGRRTGTRDTGSRRWQVSRRARIGQAHGVCRPCVPGKWCTSGRRAGQYAKWDASFLAGVRFYHIGIARTISRAICGCCFAVHTFRGGHFNLTCCLTVESYPSRIDTGFARCYSLPSEPPVRSRIRPWLEVTVWKTLFLISSN